MFVAGSRPLRTRRSRPGAHRDDGKRFVVQADEKLTAFLELERVTRESLQRTSRYHLSGAKYCHENAC
jgi:hypothetical protein